MSFRSDWREGAVFSWLICGGNRSSTEGGECRRGRTPPQISHRKDQPGSLGIVEKISQSSHPDSAVIRLKSENPDFGLKRVLLQSIVVSESAY